jgi:hypothetical protein
MTGSNHCGDMKSLTPSRLSQIRINSFGSMHWHSAHFLCCQGPKFSPEKCHGLPFPIRVRFGPSSRARTKLIPMFFLMGIQAVAGRLEYPINGCHLWHPQLRSKNILPLQKTSHWTLNMSYIEHNVFWSGMFNHHSWFWNQSKSQFSIITYWTLWNHLGYTSSWAMSVQLPENESTGQFEHSSGVHILQIFSRMFRNEDHKD